MADQAHIPTIAIRKCRIEGCERLCKQRTATCSHHGHKLRKYGDAFYQPPPKPTGCKVDGCERAPPKNKRVCEVHRWRMREHGDYNWQPPMNTQPCKLEGCENKARKYGYCVKHCDRFRRHGDPTGGGKSKGVVADFLRQASEHEDAGACLLWPWEESRVPEGYARASLNGKVMGAHRAVCILAHGEPPFVGAEAAHSCGNGHLACVNPKHLRWATHQENIAEAKAHGRRRRKVISLGEE